MEGLAGEPFGPIGDAGEMEDVGLDRGGGGGVEGVAGFEVISEEPGRGSCQRE